jgi:flagellar biosynthesis/type III secretory pathway chaperone
LHFLSKLMVVIVIDALIAILKQQLKEYENLLELAKQKQAALIINEIESLENINQAEHKCILGATKLENKRLQIIQSLKEVFGSKVETYSLKEMAKVASEPYQGELDNVYQELNIVVEELHKINQENANLIEQALKIVNYTINTIAQSEREVTYTEKDSKATKPVSRIFDSKA